MNRTHPADQRLGAHREFHLRGKSHGNPFTLENVLMCKNSAENFLWHLVVSAANSLRITPSFANDVVLRK
jgi:hypothetical protein